MIFVILENNDDFELYWCNESVIDFFYDVGILLYDGFIFSIISVVIEYFNDWE